MINGLGVLGWGVGGIEAEAGMVGQPISMLLPPVVGFKLHGRMLEGCTATDLVLTITQMLRKKGVVGKFVEFYGAGLSALSLADRATVANMSTFSVKVDHQLNQSNLINERVFYGRSFQSAPAGNSSKVRKQIWLMPFARSSPARKF